MAIDTLLAAKKEMSLPVLRLYGWKPAAISLGYHQNIDDIDMEKCRRHHIAVVHRPTGGRAVLHAEEITYAVVIPKSFFLYSQQIMRVYEKISQAILKGLQYLDINADFGRSRKNQQNYSRGELSSLCYASSIQYEINHKGKKVVGSAQRHFEHAVLQHGSILIGPKHADLPLYLKKGDSDWKKAVKAFVQKHTTCLNELSQRELTYDQVADALISGFAAVFHATLNKEDLTEQEWNLAKTLAKNQQKR